MNSIWLGVLVAMILLIAGYGLRRASRPFDPPLRETIHGIGQWLDSLGELHDEASRRRLAASIARIDHSDALAIVCPPCNGQPGRCTCAGLCGHPGCIGDHTTLGDIGPQLQAMLRQGEK